MESWSNYFFAMVTNRPRLHEIKELNEDKDAYDRGMWVFYDYISEVLHADA